jgi:outer membrane protein OmpA-like peptidoglycan-associated protein
MISWLDLSRDLQVRLIGHASPEGTEAYDQALATRRVNSVLATLTGRGLVRGWWTR